GGRVDQRGARRGRVEGDHRGPRGRYRRDLPVGRRHADRFTRRDRARRTDRERPLRGADEVVAGVVREALRAERQSRQHSSGRGDPARGPAPRPAGRHAQGDSARRRHRPGRRSCPGLVAGSPAKGADMEWKLSLAGLLIGLLVGLTGMGGGSLMTPLRVLLCAFKPSIAIGTDIVHGAICKSFGAAQHRRMGHVHARLTAWMLLGSASVSPIRGAGSWGAKRGVGGGAESTAKAILGIALVACGIAFLVKAYLHSNPEDK